MSHFKKGINALFAGFNLIIQPGIRLYVIVPFIINFFLFISVIYFGASQLQGLIDWMVNQWQWTEWLKWLFWPLFVLIALIIVFFCFTIVANIIGSPFNSFLAEAVERHLMESDSIDTVQRALKEEIVAALKGELQKLAYFMPRAIPLLILFVIPFLNISAPLLWFLFSAWMLALEYMDYPLGNHGLLFKDQRKLLFSNKPLTFGFGLGAMILTMIPVINFIAMPVAVAGATKMYVDNRQQLEAVTE